MTDEQLVALVSDAMQPLPVSTRRLFGGHGLYLAGTFFGVVSDGRLYFRTDDESRQRYLDRGMAPLQPRYRARGPRTVDRHYEVPSDVRGNSDALRAWALRAAALNGR
jgi:DNA transformation protein